MEAVGDKENYLSWRQPLKHSDSEKKYFIPKSNGGYRSVVIIDDSDNTVLVVKDIDTHEEFLFEREEVMPMNDVKLDGAEDCAQLIHLSCATLFYNLKLRYGTKLMYTYCGERFLVSINPYQFLPIYNDEVIRFYKGKRREEVPPHIFSIAQCAYFNMVVKKQSQSILITGESGAGKTENTKHVIQYLTSIAPYGEGIKEDLKQQILQANLLLEALGNAKTTKNNNSSRFSKFMKITFDDYGNISGSSIAPYLLEKHRICARGADERNFHIFYQMLEGLSSQKKFDYNLLGQPGDYIYLVANTGTHDTHKVENIDDAEQFRQTLESMDVLGFTEQERDVVFRVCAAILHLGNLQFEGEDKASVVNMNVLYTVGDLLRVDAQRLRDSIVSSSIVVARTSINVYHTPTVASVSRDALAKALYEDLFLWVVSKINHTLHAQTTHNFIGILDISGFETFKSNSFEQLCINFTNERIQQYINNCMFKLEQDEYIKENIEFQMINFNIDLQTNANLIKRVFTLLDEECVLPKATDRTFTAKISKMNSDKLKQLSDLTFSMTHYASTVQYDTTHWIEKNQDSLKHNLAETVKSSEIPVLANLFSLKQTPSQPTTRFTVSRQCCNKLDELLSTLDSTYPHFIRCIVPNYQRLKFVMEDAIVINQLKCNSILEGVKISRLGFPDCFKYTTFLNRYHLLNKLASHHDASDPRDATKAILDLLCKEDVIDAYRIQYGKTKVFFRTGVLSNIEEQLSKKK